MLAKYVGTTKWVALCHCCVGNSKGETERFIPKTPASKETKRNKVSTRISHFQQGETRSKKKKIEHLFDYVSLRNSPSIEIIEV